MTKTTVILSLFVLTFAVGCGQDITLPATGTVYGDLVFVDGSPASGIVVLVEGTGMSDVSDGNGRFVIGCVLAVDRSGMGKYYTVRGFGDRNGESVGFLVAHFKVKGQQSYSVGTVKVPKTGTITGTIHLDGMSDHSGVFVTLKGTSIETITRADGSYMLDRVPAHEGYAVPCNREGFQSMTIDQMEYPGGVEPIRVDPGVVTDLGLALLIADN